MTTPDNEYHPWIELGLSEVEYWKKRYLEARSEAALPSEEINYRARELAEEIGRALCVLDIPQSVMENVRKLYKMANTKAVEPAGWPSEIPEGVLEECRKKIEDTLIDWRDNRISEFTRNNGLVIKEKDGTDSNVIRFGPEIAVTLAWPIISAWLKSQVKLPRVERLSESALDDVAKEIINGRDGTLKLWVKLGYQAAEARILKQGEK